MEGHQTDEESPTFPNSSRTINGWIDRWMIDKKGNLVFYVSNSNQRELRMAVIISASPHQSASALWGLEGLR